MSEIDIAAVSVHGCVTGRALRELGLTDRQIAYRVRKGRLWRVHVGVYAVGRPLATPREHASAALLACGPRSALAGFTAFAFWDLPGGPGWPPVPAILVPAATRARRQGLDIHTSTTLLRRDIRTRDRLRVTSPARTLLDCAPHLDPRALRRAVGHATRRHLVRPAQLADVIARNPRHPGAKALAPFAEPHPGMPTKSPLKDDFTSFCAEHDLPRPRTNVTVAGDEVDAYFPEARLIVELDSVEFHADPNAFEADRERDARHLALNLATLRITRRRLRRHPGQEAERLRAIIAARRAQAA